MLRPIRSTRWGAPLLLVFGALAAAPAPAGAHDLWLEPSSFHPAPGARVAVRILVGHEPGDGRPVPRRPGWIERFVARGPEGESPIVGVPGVDPAGYLAVAAPGLYALGLESGETVHTLSLARFEGFLAEEGLEAAARARAGTVGADGFVREGFSRSVKSLLRTAPAAQPGPGPGAARPLGLALELVPLTDPFDPAAVEIALRVLHRGEPAAGVLVDLRRLAPGSAVSRAVSDREGEVRLPFPTAGEGGGPDAWLAAAVVLEPPEAESGVEWRSLWTSLTFARDRR